MKNTFFIIITTATVYAATGVLNMADAAVYNLHLVTGNGPDYTDMNSFAGSVTEPWKTPREKCIAIWRWGRRSRRQTSCAREHGRLIWDPILHYNSYGTMNCGVISALNIAGFLHLGYRARYIQLGDHTVSEVSWDDGATWHLFDSSMSFFCYNHKGEVAGCAEIRASHGCARSGGRKEPGHFYLYHGAPQCVSHNGPGGWRRAADQPVAYKRTLENGAFPFDKQVVHTVSHASIPAHTRQTHIKCEFFCRGGAATYGMDGIQDLWIRAEHEPRQKGFAPIDITYNWTEHRSTGNVTRSHTERVASLPHEYTINTAGFRDPTMHWVRLQLSRSAPEKKETKTGYSDGEDVGAGCEPVQLVYRWGKNLAQGRPYQVNRPSSATSGNPDANGRELTNGIIIAPTDYTTSQSVQAATAFWEGDAPVSVVVDLGAVQPVAGVRISTHQPDRTYCHPGSMEVSLSTDNKRFQPAGAARHNDLWKPPAGYEPWEHDDSPRYKNLPACGRLAYSYPVVFDAPAPARYVRFLITPLPGRGTGLSEMEVFDRVLVENFTRPAKPLQFPPIKIESLK